MKSRLLPALLLLCAGLAACTDTRTGYPSLAPRPIEREVLRADAPPAAAPVAAAPLPSSADISAIVRGAEAADAAFRAALEKARARVEAGRAAPEGSEAWIVGQQAYSTADAARAPVSEALADLDRRREAAVDAGDADAEAAAAEALGQVQALYDAEQALLAALMPA